MNYLKQSTARTLLIGPFLDETTGKDAEAGLTITQADVRLSKNGGNMAQKNEATSCVHDELGYYTCPIDDTDTATLGILKVMVHETGALPVFQEFLVVTANVWDTLCSTDQLDVNTTHITGTAQTANDNGADINAILTDTADLQGNQAAWATATGFATETKQDIIDGIVDRILTATEVRQKAINDAGASTTTFITTLVETDNDFWNRMAILFTSGNNAGQMRRIKDYNGGTKAVTVLTPFNAAPANADTFVILPIRAFLTSDTEDIADAIWDEAQSGHVAAGTFGVIASEIAAIPTTAMRGTDDANTVVPDVAGTAATPAEVATALTNIHLDHLFAADYDPASKPGVATALLNELIENDVGVSRYTANSLEQAPSGSGATAAEVRIEIDANSTKLSSIETDTKGISDTACSADAASPTVNSLADIVRRMKWFVANLWEIDENATPDTFKIFKDDNTTVGLNFTVYTDSSKSYRDNTP